MVIGVLALQGAFAKHLEVFQNLKVPAVAVRRPEELEPCSALVIPGGESTTIAHHLRCIGLSSPILEFGKKKPIFGTCAGLILLANEWGLLNAEVERNGYGRQYESFSAEIDTEIGGSFHAIFIRAPRIKKLGSKAKILASFNQEPVLVQQGTILASTFHPELTNDFSIHRHFLTLL